MRDDYDYAHLTFAQRADALAEWNSGLGAPSPRGLINAPGYMTTCSPHLDMELRDFEQFANLERKDKIPDRILGFVSRRFFDIELKERSQGASLYHLSMKAQGVHFEIESYVHKGQAEKARTTLASMLALVIAGSIQDALALPKTPAKKRVKTARRRLIRMPAPEAPEPQNDGDSNVNSGFADMQDGAQDAVNGFVNEALKDGLGTTALTKLLLMASGASDRLGDCGLAAMQAVANGIKGLSDKTDEEEPQKEELEPVRTDWPMSHNGAHSEDEDEEEDDDPQWDEESNGDDYDPGAGTGVIPW